MKRAALSVCGGLVLGLALACGGIGSGSDGSVSRGYDDSPPMRPGAEAYPVLDHAYRVAPDRALVAVNVRVEGDTLAASNSALDARVAEVIAAVTSGGAGCSAVVVDFETPSASGGDRWVNGAEVRVDVDLHQLEDVGARRARIDACLAPLDPLLTRDEWRKIGTSAQRVARSEPLVDVDDPEGHRDRLLERERARLSWAAAAGGAPQFHPEDLRCVPDGTVRVGDRRLSGVSLSLGMDCRIDGAADAAGAGPAPSP